jgi:hypothetical protein
MSAKGSGDPRAPARGGRLRAAAAAAAVLAVAAAAVAFARTGADGAAPLVRLTVSYVPRDGAARQVAHLRCTSSRRTADAFLRRVGPGLACRHARRIARFLASRPPSGRACTQIFGGPQRARITGRIGARRIDRRLARRDGCEVSDYNRAVPLVPRAPREGG